MGAHDRRGDGAHTHANSGVLAWRGRITNRVDLRMGDRTQKGIDDNLVALIHGQSSFTCQRRNHESSRPDAEVTGDLACLIKDNTVRTHGSNRGLIDALDSQADEGTSDRAGNSLALQMD